MLVVVLTVTLLFMPFCRSLSTISSPSIPLAISGTVATKDESRDFMAVFPDVVRDLTETGRHLDIPDATKWFAKVSI
jgi:farnesyl diphosphate synthase